MLGLLVWARVRVMTAVPLPGPSGVFAGSRAPKGAARRTRADAIGAALAANGPSRAARKATAPEAPHRPGND